MNEPKRKYMQTAIDAAIESAENGDYAHGAVVVIDDEIISIGYETLKSDFDPVNGHAEVDAIRKACKKLQQPYLQGAVLYSVAEPCPMCISAAIWAKVDTVVFATTRQDMIDEMERLTKENDGNFSWRQIAVPAKYIVERGKPDIHLVEGFMREEGQIIFKVTGKK